MSKKKVITLLLTLAMILSLSVGVSAAETTEAKVPITLTVVNTVTPISCTVFGVTFSSGLNDWQ